MNPLPTTEEIALAWAVRTARPDFVDWPGLMAWLGGDADRNRAYDRAMTIVADLVVEEPVRTATIVALPMHKKFPASSAGLRRWFPVTVGAALAATVAGIVVLGQSHREPAWRIVQTPPGQLRTIVLTDGSRIDLAGGSRLRIDDARPRLARLDRGRAVFTVHHDPQAPYEVEAGGHRVIDVGTIFEVVAQGLSETQVAVAEGRIIVDPAGSALMLLPGEAAELVDGRAPKVERIGVATVGQWRHRQLHYDDAPLGRVAADLSAALGQAIVIDASARDIRFSGTVTPTTLRDKPKEVAGLFNVRVIVSTQGWEFRSR